MTYRTDLNTGVGGTGSPGAVEVDRDLSGAFLEESLELCLFLQPVSQWATPSNTAKSIPG